MAISNLGIKESQIHQIVCDFARIRDLFWPSFSASVLCYPIITCAHHTLLLSLHEIYLRGTWHFLDVESIVNLLKSNDRFRDSFKDKWKVIESRYGTIRSFARNAQM